MNNFSFYFSTAIFFLISFNVSAESNSRSGWQTYVLAPEQHYSFVVRKGSDSCDPDPEKSVRFRNFWNIYGFRIRLLTLKIRPSIAMADRHDVVIQARRFGHDQIPAVNIRFTANEKVTDELLKEYVSDGIIRRFNVTENAACSWHKIYLVYNLEVALPDRVAR